MILRKPYAILIKNFKLIHFFMALLMGYLFYKTNMILSFFTEYLSSVATTITNEVTSSLFNPILVLVIILIILASAIILALMFFKNKPVKFYIYNILTYVLLAIFYYVTFTYVKSLELGLIDVRILKVLHDLSLVALFIQGLGLLIVIVRTTGFDIKSFDFKKDLEELDIDVADNEEFEVEMEFDTDKIKRRINKKIRHAKYIYIENKMVINILILFVIFISSLLIYLNIGVYNKVFKLNEAFKTNEFIFNFTNSYQTKYDYRSKVVKKDYELVVVKLKLKNLYTKEKPLNTGNFYLDVGGYKYYHTLIYKDKVSDIGVSYRDQNITTDFSDYLLVFEIPKSRINKKMILNYTDIDRKVIKINVTPVSLNKRTEVTKSNLNEELKFTESILKDTTLVLNGYEFSDTFTLNYDYCINNDCYNFVEYLTKTVGNNTSSTILKLSGNLGLDEEIKSTKFNNLFKFIKYFGTIKYEIAGTTKTINPNNLVQLKPKKAISKDCYIEVPSELNLADKIDIEFNIRNKIYIYNIK